MEKANKDESEKTIKKTATKRTTAKKTTRKKKGTTKQKPRGKKIQDTLAPVTDPGDNKKYIEVSMKLATLPEIDLHDPKQVEARIMEFFRIHADMDLKPTVAGFALALNGMDRRRLWEIRTDVPNRNQNIPTFTRDLIKRWYKILEILWENYMQNGKINPVAGIFLGTNNYGYLNKAEYIVTPNVQNDPEDSVDDIKAKYLNGSTTLALDSAEGNDSELDINAVNDSMLCDSDKDSGF